MKKKCSVCGMRFRPERDKVYQVHEPQAPIDAISKAAKQFDVVDCPQCGCQVALAVRMPAVVVKDDEAEAGEDE